MQKDDSNSRQLSAAIPFALIDAPEYYQALAAKIPLAKERIVLAAMVFLWGSKTDVIFAKVAAALKRGVKVHLLLDNYSGIGLAYNALGSSERRVRIAKTLQIVKELETKGARVTRFGKIGLNPYKGRCHVKLTVIDDEAYSFGGMNFTDESFQNIDYMFYTRSRAVADCLEQLADRISTQKPPLPDGEVIMDDTSSILFDGGKPKHSIIYERACQFAAGAAQIYAVSQLVPSGRLGEIIRRKPSEVYYNRPSQLPAPNSWGQAFDEHKHRLKNRYDKKRIIHAKFILFEMPNGERITITGSNNFSYRGVAFGTQEIALQSSQPEVWDQLYKYMRKSLV